MSITELAPAKLNLTLDVGARRPGAGKILSPDFFGPPAVKPV